MVEGEDMTNYPLVPFPLLSFTCSSCSKAFPAMNKLNHHYIEMHKDPMSCTICCKTFSSKKLFIRHSCVHLPPTSVASWSITAVSWMPWVVLLRGLTSSRASC